MMKRVLEPRPGVTKQEAFRYAMEKNGFICSPNLTFAERSHQKAFEINAKDCKNPKEQNN